MKISVVFNFCSCLEKLEKIRKRRKLICILTSNYQYVLNLTMAVNLQNMLAKHIICLIGKILNKNNVSIWHSPFESYLFILLNILVSFFFKLLNYYWFEIKI